MPEIFDIDPELVQHFTADQVPSPATFNAAISREDEMLLHALAGYRGDCRRASVTYLLQGKQMMDQLRQIVDWTLGGWSGVSSFLDFACGYGRFTRHLVQELAPTNIWASDIYVDAVRFQREQFGVHGFPSVTRPDELSLDRRFDVIFVSSLFSHLPRRTFEPWLSRLVSSLTERGLLIFTTHGIELAGTGDEDFVFRPNSESRTLDIDEYGTAYVSERFVGDAIQSAAGAAHVHSRHVPHGHLGFQDLYVVSRDPAVDLVCLPYRTGFFGHVGSCWMGEDGKLHLRGWAADLGTQESSVRVRILANDRVVHECSPDHDRPDVAKHLMSANALRSGWSCQLGAGRLDRVDWISVKVVNEDGRNHTIALDRLDSMLSW